MAECNPNYVFYRGESGFLACDIRTVGTVEARIQGMQERKKKLADSIVEISRAACARMKLATLTLRGAGGRIRYQT